MCCSGAGMIILGSSGNFGTGNIDMSWPTSKGRPPCFTPQPDRMLTRFCGRGTVVETFRASRGNGSLSGSLTLFFNVFDIVEIGMFANIRQHRLAHTHLIHVKLTPFAIWHKFYFGQWNFGR
jgi:hypothetical protein